MLMVGVGLLVSNLRNNHEFPGRCPKILALWFYLWGFTGIWLNAECSGLQG